MDKATDRGMFVNDGSFMERFKQLQQEKDKKDEGREKSLSGSSTSVTSYSKTVNSKPTLNFKANNSQKIIQSPSSGKLAFSLKQKSKLVSPAVKFDEDEDEDGDKNDRGRSLDDVPMKRPKLAEIDVSDQQSQADVGFYLMRIVQITSIICIDSVKSKRLWPKLGIPKHYKMEL